MQLTCKTSGSKPAADIRWFKNDKEIKGKEWVKLFNQSTVFEVWWYPKIKVVFHI